MSDTTPQYFLSKENSVTQVLDLYNNALCSNVMFTGECFFTVKGILRVKEKGFYVLEDLEIPGFSLPLGYDFSPEDFGCAVGSAVVLTVKPVTWIHRKSHLFSVMFNAVGLQRTLQSGRSTVEESKALQNYLKNLLNSSSSNKFYTKNTPLLRHLTNQIAVICSSHDQSSAFQDVRANLNNYNKNRIERIGVPITSANQVAKAIISASKNPNYDIIAIVRGGGDQDSFEAFNSDQVVSAIINSPKFVITGLGHTRDYTLADLVADAKVSVPAEVGNLLNNMLKASYFSNRTIDTKAIFIKGMLAGAAALLLLRLLF